MPSRPSSNNGKPPQATEPRRSNSTGSPSISRSKNKTVTVPPPRSAASDIMDESNLQLAKPMTPVKVAPAIIPDHDALTSSHRSNSFNGSISRHNSFNSNNNHVAVDPSQTTSSAGGTAEEASNNGVDFIGPSNAVKHLFSLPYNNDRSVSVALHNMGNGTILLDSGEDIVDSPASAVQEGGPATAGANSRSNGRRGRRRQRPQSWSIKEEQAEEEDSESEQLQLAQLREGERSLLASLSLLLEEEKRQEQKSHQTSVTNDESEGGVIQDSSDGRGQRDLEPSTKNALILSPASQRGKELKESDDNESSALVVPSNAIVVRGGATDNDDDPIVTSAPAVTSTQHATGSTDPSDPLASNLPSPQQYLSHVVSPPTEPRQYVDWKFRDMKLLIASDAVIYNKNDHEAGSSSHDVDDTSDSIAIRVADASDLKSQMKYHQTMIGRRSQHQALPPSSYAEAVSKNDERDANTGDDDDMGSAVKLQTCIIPTSGAAPEWANEWAQLGFTHSSSCPPSAVEENDMPAGIGSEDPSEPLSLTSTSPVCTVLDAYLDNIMANVPQLALILREHGFVQNIKLLRTEEIPSLMMHPSTLGDNNESGHPSNTPVPPTAAHPPEVFSPEIVEMNAAMLLRFLKTNCTRENSTYLLHRAAGEGNQIQLFDISGISEMRQRKWVWWLALCSYRFACRLEQLQTNVLSPNDKVTRREYRNRQRSLLHNTLSLLEELADMDGGGRHETIGAAVCEHLADTYLWNDEIDGEVGARGVRDSGKAPAPCASSSQPYSKVTVDCLNKAHDHLMNGIKKLTPLLSKAKKEKSPSKETIEAISMQLYGIHHKVVNVNLRLADHHLQNYFSSNLIQSLRTAGRMLSDATSLLEPLNMFEFGKTQSTAEKNTLDDSNMYGRSILLQYAWLWEYCGHFARSFAADDLWRDRGHTCGADLIGLFREVNASCGNIMKRCFGPAKWKSKTSIGAASHGQVSLDLLSGIVILPEDFEEIEASVLQKEGCHEAIGAAKVILSQKTQIKRDACLVLVAASVCYGHAIDSYVFLNSQNDEEEDVNHSKQSSAGKTSERDSDGMNLIPMTPPGPTTVAPLLRQRLGDACNEIGKIMLGESRAVLLPEFSPPAKISISKKSFGMSHVSAIMLASAQFWFVEGLEQFTEGKDLRNIALLRCNLCQCCKIRANTNVILPGTSVEDSRKNNSESYLQEAVDHLVLAHEAMGERDADPLTWDMVSEELAATLLVLGVRRRQSALSSSSEPLLLQALRLTPGAEKSIVEPMERSCLIYESLGTARASHQAAAAHYQLALYFSKVWTCQRDEAKTREKLAAAFKHYGLAHQFFFQHIQGNETTFIVLSLDFSNLYSAVSGEECLSKSLLCCLDTRMAFSHPVDPASMEQMLTLADNVESRISKLLLSLVKIEKNNNSKLRAGQEPSERYKNMYRKVLSYKMLASGNAGSNIQEVSDTQPSLPIFELLNSLHDLATT